MPGTTAAAVETPGEERTQGAGSVPPAPIGGLLVVGALLAGKALLVVCALLAGEASVDTVVGELLSRPLRSEGD